MKEKKEKTSNSILFKMTTSNCWREIAAFRRVYDYCLDSMTLHEARKDYHRAEKRRQGFLILFEKTY